ncbi:MAG: hypothetical protein Fur007_09210 [Rhodoferax sp.]
MNSRHDTTSSPASVDDWARAVAHRLDEVALRADLAQRLRAAREQAVDQRRWILMRAADQRLATAHGTLQSTEPAHFGLITLLVLLAMMAGLWLLHDLQTDRKAHELADVDRILLTDDLPPTAYLDPGFRAFLKLSFPDQP